MPRGPMTFPMSREQPAVTKSPFWTAGVPIEEKVLSWPEAVGWLSLQKPESQSPRVEYGSQRPEPQPFQQSPQESCLLMAPWVSWSDTGWEVKAGGSGLARPGKWLALKPAVCGTIPSPLGASAVPGPPRLRSSTRGVLPDHPQNAPCTLHPAWRVGAGQVWALGIVSVPVGTPGGPFSGVCLGQPPSWHTAGAQ